jgi:hypothetical protein
MSPGRVEARRASAHPAAAFSPRVEKRCRPPNMGKPGRPPALATCYLTPL